MKMKIVVSGAFALSIVISSIAPVPFTAPVAIGLLYGAYGILRSRRRRLDPLNDVPNAFRVFLASLGGTLIPYWHVFIFPALGLIAYASSVLLNDEFQRRTVSSVRSGKRGGSLALLGIDGSGKSTHSSLTKLWLEQRGYRTVLTPFHKYLFVERLSSARPSSRGKAPRRGGNPLRPLLSFADNLVLQVFTSFGCRAEGTVIIYDRFIWSTYVKYFALGYPVRPLSPLYLSPRPRLAVVLDVPVERSLGVIKSRATHIQYQRHVLETERGLYLELARARGYPIIDSTRDSQVVQLEIERYLSRNLPAAKARH